MLLGSWCCCLLATSAAAAAAAAAAWKLLLAAAAAAGYSYCCCGCCCCGGCWGGCVLPCVGCVGVILGGRRWHSAFRLAMACCDSRPGFCCLKSPSVVYLPSFRHPPLGHKSYIHPPFWQVRVNWPALSTCTYPICFPAFVEFCAARMAAGPVLPHRSAPDCFSCPITSIVCVHGRPEKLYIPLLNSR